MKKSMVTVAYEVMLEVEGAIEFGKLWQEVCERLEFSEAEASKKISSFYTQLTLDGRFVREVENTWNLRSRLKFENVHIDMNDIYLAEDDEEEKLLSEIDDIDSNDIDEDEEEDSDDEEKEDKKSAYEQAGYDIRESDSDF